MLWFIFCPPTIPPFFHFYSLLSFNLICGGRVAARKIKQALKLDDAKTNSLFICVHVFGNPASLGYTHGAAVVREKFYITGFCFLFRARGTDGKALGSVCGCDGKCKCQGRAHRQEWTLVHNFQRHSTEGNVWLFETNKKILLFLILESAKSVTNGKLSNVW